MDKKNLYSLITLLCITLSSSLFAQDNVEAENNLEERPSEIIIQQKRSHYQVQRLMFRAEEDFYTTFNQLVDDRRFKIYCSTEDRYFSHTRIRECKPQFERDADSVVAQGYLSEFRLVYGGGAGELPAGTSPLYAPPPSKYNIIRQQEELESKMEDLVTNNPELREALIEYTELRSQYLYLKGRDVE